MDRCAIMFPIITGLDTCSWLTEGNDMEQSFGKPLLAKHRHLMEYFILCKTELRKPLAKRMYHLEMLRSHFLKKHLRQIRYEIHLVRLVQNKNILLLMKNIHTGLTMARYCICVA